VRIEDFVDRALRGDAQPVEAASIRKAVDLADNNFSGL
jgi:hypothetical protein